MMGNVFYRITILLLATFGLMAFTTQKMRNLPEVSAQQQVTRLKAGQPALNFRYRDINGKWVSLKDFKGKYVYIDIWATWCGPCCGEIPFLKTLEKEMEKNKIRFVSISCDNDKTAWERFVREKGLGGVQLYMGQAKDMNDFYSINSIPRFILIDKKGNIVNASMTRPSDKATKTMLMNLKGI